MKGGLVVAALLIAYSIWWPGILVAAAASCWVLKDVSLLTKGSAFVQIVVKDLTIGVSKRKAAGSGDVTGYVSTSTSRKVIKQVARDCLFGLRCHKQLILWFATKTRSTIGTFFMTLGTHR